MKVPFNKPYLPETAFEFIREAGQLNHLSGDGIFTRRVEDWMRSMLGVEHVLLTTSCTSALEMAMILTGAGPGDEVIVPSFTFVSCANAVVLRGATPVFADVDPATLSVSPETIEEAVTARTRVVMPVHYAGVAPQITEVVEFCEQRGLSVIEDAAHAFLGRTDSKPLGTFGNFGAFSFHETKNFSMGEGGALVVRSDADCDRAEIIREKGTNRRQFFNGMVDKYTWVDIGSSYVPSEILAAVLWAQFSEADTIRSRRAMLWERYDNALRPWAAQHGFTRPIVPANSEPTYHIYYVLAPDSATRNRLLHRLQALGVGAVFHYLPLEESVFGQQFRRHPCPNSTSASERLVRLPLFHTMTLDEIDFVIDCVTTERS